MSRPILLAAVPFLMGVTINGVTISGVALDPASRTQLYDENFEGAGTPTGWTTQAGTPDYDYSEDSQESLRVETSTEEQGAEALNVITGTDSVKCFEFNMKLADHGSTQFMRIVLAGASDFAWRLEAVGTDTGNIGGRCGNTSFSTQDLAFNTVIGVEWEIDAVNGDCRISFDDATPITVDGAAEATDRVTGLRWFTNTATTGFDHRLQDISIYDGTCLM